MPTARGFVKCDGSRFVGTFNIDGGLRYVTGNVRPLDLSFECGSATLTYDDVTQLVGEFKWTGTAGRDDLEMTFVGGVTIVGPLTTPRSSIRIRGAGLWGSVKPDLPLLASNNVPDISANSSPSHDAVRDAAKAAREQELIDLGVPIIAYANDYIYILIMGNSFFRSLFGKSGVGKSTVRLGTGSTCVRYLRLTLSSSFRSSST